MSYIITRSSSGASTKPYENSRQVEVAWPFERRISDTVVEKGNRIEMEWITDDDPITVFLKEQCDVIINRTNNPEYPVGIEIYDDYRE